MFFPFFDFFAVNVFIVTFLLFLVSHESFLLPSSSVLSYSCLFVVYFIILQFFCIVSHLYIFSVWEQGQDHSGDGACRRWRTLRLHQQQPAHRTRCSTRLQTNHLRHQILPSGKYILGYIQYLSSCKYYQLKTC